MTSTIEVLLVTGQSGAGRSAAARALEDLGWYVIDNLPPDTVGVLVDHALAATTRIHRLAIVVDVRSRAFRGDLRPVLDQVTARGGSVRVLFLAASDTVLVRRFEQVRRGHPLQDGGTLVEAITAEAELLRPLRDSADLVIDTTTLTEQRLRQRIEAAFGEPEDTTLRIAVQSFGFKYGLPTDADMVVDVRFLPNPHWVPELRPHTGQSPAVRDYVLGQDGADDFLTGYARLIDLITDGYLREGKRYATIAVGCTGGKHRSVAMSEALAKMLASRPALSVGVIHRDLGRE